MPLNDGWRSFSDVAAMVDPSKRTMANIRRNITGAIGLKAVFLVTTVAGVTAFGRSFSSTPARPCC